MVIIHYKGAIFNSFFLTFTRALAPRKTTLRILIPMTSTSGKRRWFSQPNTFDPYGTVALIRAGRGNLPDLSEQLSNVVKRWWMIVWAILWLTYVKVDRNQKQNQLLI